MLNNQVIYDGHCHLASIQNLDNKNNQSIAIAAITEQDWSLLATTRNNCSLYKIGFGLHPWYIHQLTTKEQQDNYAQRLDNAIKLYRPDFIGETGLDALKPNLTLQRVFFNIHLKLATQYNLPIVMHCVKAYSELIQDLNSYKINGLLHGFNSSTEIAQELLKRHIMIGIGSLILHPKTKLINVIQKIPSTHLIIESDAPYMPCKNQQKSTSKDCLIYAQKIAHYLQKNLNDLITEVNYNWLELYS